MLNVVTERQAIWRTLDVRTTYAMSEHLEVTIIKCTFIPCGQNLCHISRTMAEKKRVRYPIYDHKESSLLYRSGKMPQFQVNCA